MGTVRTVFLVLWLALGSLSASVDPKTGITFETFSAPNGYRFGIAVPPTPTSDFIGQLVSNPIAITSFPLAEKRRLSPRQRRVMEVYH